MKKQLIAALIAAAFVVPSVAKAEGMIVGTDAYALGVDGISNAFVQGKIGDKGAWLVEGASAAGVSIFQGSYKGYLGDYANSLYWSAGLVIATNGASSLTGVTGKVGYEATLGESFVISPYFGAISISGLASSGVGVNVGFKF